MTGVLIELGIMILLTRLFDLCTLEGTFDKLTTKSVFGQEGEVYIIQN